MSMHIVTAVKYGDPKPPTWQKPILHSIKEEFLSFYNADLRVVELEDLGYEVKLELARPRHKVVTESYYDRYKEAA